jgi:hypothetical protein
MDIGFNVSGVLKILLEEPKTRVFITASYGNFTVKGEGNMAYTLPVDMGLRVAVSYVDAKGNPVDLPQGNVSWDTSDPTIVHVDPDQGDDQQAFITPIGTLGNAQITCTGSNADGSKVIATLDITIVAGNAITGTIQPQGAPEPLAPHVAPNK